MPLLYRASSLSDQYSAACRYVAGVILACLGWSTIKCAMLLYRMESKTEQS